MARSHGGYFRLGVISGAHTRSAPSPRSLRESERPKLAPDRWHERCKLACRSRPDLPARARELAGMSTFDNPFDPKRRLNRSGCSCGQHRSQAEHDSEAQRQLQCENVEREQTRYEGVVAVSGNARCLSAGIRAPCIPQSSRRIYGVGRLVSALPAQDSDRGVCRYRHH